MHKRTLAIVVRLGPYLGNFNNPTNGQTHGGVCMLFSQADEWMWLGLNSRDLLYQRTGPQCLCLEPKLGDFFIKSTGPNPPVRRKRQSSDGVTAQNSALARSRADCKRRV